MQTQCSLMNTQKVSDKHTCKVDVGNRDDTAPCYWLEVGRDGGVFCEGGRQYVNKGTFLVIRLL